MHHLGQAVAPAEEVAVAQGTSLSISLTRCGLD
jgi:hypothetical protein